MDNYIYSSGMCITKAAAMARGLTSVDKIKGICESQKSISTSKLSGLISLVEEDIKLHGIFLSEVGRRMKRLEDAATKE